MISRIGNICFFACSKNDQYEEKFVFCAYTKNNRPKEVCFLCKYFVVNLNLTAIDSSKAKAGATVTTPTQTAQVVYDV